MFISSSTITLIAIAIISTATIISIWSLVITKEKAYFFTAIIGLVMFFYSSFGDLGIGVKDSLVYLIFSFLLSVIFFVVLLNFKNLEELRRMLSNKKESQKDVPLNK